MMMFGEVRRGSTHVDITEVKPEELLRLGRLAVELRLTDQILSDDLDTLSIVEGGPAAAWTSGEGNHVTFNLKKMPMPDTPANIRVWLGTNAHELGHVKYTPRKDSDLLLRVMDAERVFMTGIKQLWNIAEDQRQERLMLGRFQPWAPYLVEALGYHLVADTESAWLLFAGRTWLSDDIRAQARAMLIAQRSAKVADQVAELIGNYQSLTDTGDKQQNDAWDILVDLHRLFGDDLPKMPPVCEPIGEGEEDTSEPGGSVPPRADEDPEPQPGRPRKDDDDGVETPKRDADADTDGSDGDGDDDGDDKGDDGKGKGESKPAPDDAADSEPVRSAGAGNDPNATPPKPGELDPNAMKKRLRDEAEEQTQEDAEAKKDLNDVLDALDHGRTQGEAKGEHSAGNYVDVSSDARRLYDEVSRELMDLKDECEPGWNKRVASGRLNVRRLLNSHVVDPDTLYDRYEPGQVDATSVEVMLLLDVSGSMSSVIDQVGEATWAIRKAVDDLEGDLTVITWQSGPHEVLAHPGDRPEERMFVPTVFGGTNPHSALVEAYRVLADSQAPIKLMVILTDGSWGVADESEQLIDAMNAGEVSTALAFVSTDYSFITGAQAAKNRPAVKVNAHHCQVGRDIGNDPHGLALMFREIVAERIKAQR